MPNALTWLLLAALALATSTRLWLGARQIRHVRAHRNSVPQTFADVSKARRLLGYDPQTKIEDGLKRFVEWFLSERKPER